MQPIYDNIKLLLNLSKTERHNGHEYHELINQNFIKIEPLTYIHKHNIPNQFLIINKTQNLTPHKIKTIISHTNKNTKIILTKNPYQIDNPYINNINNNLTHTINHFINKPITTHITLTHNEHSELTKLTTNLL